MRSGKVISVAAHNWKAMLKGLLCQIVILALMSALALMIFGGLVEEIVGALSSVDFSEISQDIFQAMQNNTFDAEQFSQQLSQIIAEIRTAVETIPNVWNRVEVSYVVCFLLLFVYRLLISLTDVAVAFEVQEFMTSNASRPFTWYFVKKFWESLQFSAVQMLLTLPLDAMILIFSGAIYLLLAWIIGVWAMIPAIVMFIVMYTARHTLLAFWLPSIASDELKVRQSLTKGVSAIPYRFGQVFWQTLLITIGMVAISLVSITYIHNSILKIIVATVPNFLLFFLLKCVNLVEYFECSNRPYFSKNVDVEGTERYNKKAARRNRRLSR